MIGDAGDVQMLPPMWEPVGVGLLVGEEDRRMPTVLLHDDAFQVRTIRRLSKALERERAVLACGEQIADPFGRREGSVA